MPKIKIKRKSTAIDMTAMCDVAFLLLTFFMLTSKFKAQEAVTIDMPASRSEFPIPDKDLMVISVDKDGKAFFSVDNQNVRAELLDSMAAAYNVTFTPAQKKTFMFTENFGVDIRQLPQLMDATNEKKLQQFSQPGIPMDTVNNQLGDWILKARYINPKMRIAIKGDRLTDVPAVNRVIEILQERKTNRFNLITTLKTESNK